MEHDFNQACSKRNECNYLHAAHYQRATMNESEWKPDIIHWGQFLPRSLSLQTNQWTRSSEHRCSERVTTIQEKETSTKPTSLRLLLVWGFEDSYITSPLMNLYPQRFSVCILSLGNAWHLQLISHRLKMHNSHTDTSLFISCIQGFSINCW